jgi:hypothetical protein
MPFVAHWARPKELKDAAPKPPLPPPPFDD